MNKQSRYIGINQKVPIGLLEKYIMNYLETGVIDSAAIKADISLVYKGKNRASKAFQYANRILSHNKTILEFIQKRIGNERYKRLNGTDKHAITLALISLAYPLFYDVIVVLAKVFRVQELVSRRYIAQKIGSLYGSNRTLEIALDAIFPMLVDLNLILRAKRGVYSAVPCKDLVDDKVAELFVAIGIRLSGGKQISIDDFEYRDWHFFLKPKQPPYQNQVLLVISKTGAKQGYIEFKNPKELDKKQLTREMEHKNDP